MQLIWSDLLSLCEVSGRSPYSRLLANWFPFTKFSFRLIYWSRFIICWSFGITRFQRIHDFHNEKLIHVSVLARSALSSSNRYGAAAYVHTSLLPAQLVKPLLTAAVHRDCELRICNTHRKVEMGDIAQSCGEKASFVYNMAASRHRQIRARNPAR